MTALVSAAANATSDPAARTVERRNLDPNSIPWQNTHEIDPRPTGEMSENRMSRISHDAKQRVRQRLCDFAFHHIGCAPRQLILTATRK
jgi:hypothetical protein